MACVMTTHCVAVAIVSESCDDRKFWLLRRSACTETLCHKEQWPPRRVHLSHCWQRHCLSADLDSMLMSLTGADNVKGGVDNARKEIKDGL